MLQEVKQTDGEKLESYRKSCTYADLVRMHCALRTSLGKENGMMHGAYEKQFTFDELAAKHIALEKGLRQTPPVYAPRPCPTREALFAEQRAEVADPVGKVTAEDCGKLGAPPSIKTEKEQALAEFSMWWTSQTRDAEGDTIVCDPHAKLAARDSWLASRGVEKGVQPDCEQVPDKPHKPPPRNLSQVIGEVLVLVPHDGPRGLIPALKSIRDSLNYSPPENDGMWWRQFCALLEDRIPYPPVAEWERQVYRLVTLKEPPPSELCEVSDAKSENSDKRAKSVMHLRQCFYVEVYGGEDGQLPVLGLPQASDAEGAWRAAHEYAQRTHIPCQCPECTDSTAIDDTDCIGNFDTLMAFGAWWDANTQKGDGSKARDKRELANKVWFASRNWVLSTPKLRRQTQEKYEK